MPGNQLPLAIVTALLALSPSTPGRAEAGILLTNGSFATNTDGKPDAWTVRGDKQKVTIDSSDSHHPAQLRALRVEITRDGGSSYGEIVQSVKVAPDTAYRFAGDWRSSKGKVAFFQIKRIKEGQELERIPLPWSETAWQRVVRTVNSGEADELQVLCRYRQKKAYVGTSCWYTNIFLTKSADSAAGVDTVSTISEPIAAPEPKLPVFDLAATNPDLIVAAPGADQFVTPEGAGEQTGADWDNARSAKDGGLQVAWNAVGPSNTLFLGSGEYRDILLEILAGGGSPAAMKRLQGVDTGTGLPLFTGSLDMDKIRDGWQTMIKGSPNTGYWSLADLRFRNCSCAIRLYGSNVGVRISGIDVERVREAFNVYGVRNPDDKFATRDVVISDCTVNIYTKRCLRIRDGVSDLSVIRVRADAGGREWFREAFPIGFHVESEAHLPPCHDITYIDCSASGNWHPNGDAYWNADGFGAENRASGIVYLRCHASNNTDGGWDDKSANPVLIDCVALRNKRNYRFWSRPGPATLQNCVSAYAIDHRSGKPGTGMWLAKGASVRASHTTFYANRHAIHLAAEGRPTFCELDHCLLAGDKDSLLIEAGNGGEVTMTSTSKGTIGDAETDPQLTSPTPDWPSGDSAFHSKRFPDRGVQHRAKEVK